MAPAFDGPPDLTGIGNAATAPKRASGAGRELREFSVKRGDNGGVIVCETYRSTPPEGRRYGASFPDGSGDYTENPFSPDDSAGASTFIASLLGQMGVAPTEAPAPDEADAEAPPAPPMGGGGPPMGGPMMGGPGGPGGY